MSLEIYGMFVSRVQNFHGEGGEVIGDLIHVRKQGAEIIGNLACLLKQLGTELCCRILMTIQGLNGHFWTSGISHFFDHSGPEWSNGISGINFNGSTIHPKGRVVFTSYNYL